jgi:histone H3/H4
MGQMWNSMPTEEKEQYQQQAAQERGRVAKELEDWKAAGGVIEVDTIDNRDPNSLIFPMARIRKIVKLDPEVRGLSKEALLLITKCAEMATSKLGQETVRVARLQNRRKLLAEDVAQVCAHREQFMFLKDDIKDLVKNTIDTAAAAALDGGKAAPKADAAREKAAAGSKPLTSYFGASSASSNKQP